MSTFSQNSSLFQLIIAFGCAVSSSRKTLYFAGIDESDGEASFIVANPYDAIAFNTSNTSHNDEMETATQFFLNFTCPDFGKPVQLFDATICFGCGLLYLISQLIVY